MLTDRHENSRWDSLSQWACGSPGLSSSVSASGVCIILRHLCRTIYCLSYIFARGLSPGAPPWRYLTQVALWPAGVLPRRVTLFSRGLSLPGLILLSLSPHPPKKCGVQFLTSSCYFVGVVLGLKGTARVWQHSPRDVCSVELQHQSLCEHRLVCTPQWLITSGNGLAH